MAMPAAEAWSLGELHRLPDDGNRYELVFGDLFVTPAPTEEHETIAARLHDLLAPFVKEHRLGLVYRPRAVIQYSGSEAEPDLMVRAERMRRTGSWIGAPSPRLVVEIVSPVTRRRDYGAKRAFYLEAGVDEYWIIDPRARSVTVARAGREDVRHDSTVTWTPSDGVAGLTVDVEAIFAGLEQAEE